MGRSRLDVQPKPSLQAAREIIWRLFHELPLSEILDQSRSFVDFRPYFENAFK